MTLTQYTIERKFAASPQRLFEAFTRPDELAAWVWGELAKPPSVEIDLRINGLVSIAMDSGKGQEPAMRGVYLVIESGRKLIHTVHWDADVGYNRGGGKPVDEVVVVDFVPSGESCLVRYLHMGIPEEGNSAAEHQKAVSATFDVLEKRLSKPR